MIVECSVASVKYRSCIYYAIMTDLVFKASLEGMLLCAAVGRDSTVADFKKALADEYPELNTRDLVLWRGVNEAEDSCPMKVFESYGILLLSRKFDMPSFLEAFLNP